MLVRHSGPADVRGLVALTLAALLASSIGCESSSTLVRTTSPTEAFEGDGQAISGVARILILPPVVLHADAALDSTVPADEQTGQAVAQQCREILRRNQVREAMLWGGEHELPTDPTGAGPACLRRLFLADPDPALLRDVESWAASHPRTAVLALYVRIKAGPGGFREFGTGQVGASASTTQLRALLVGAPGQGILWKHAVLLRDVLIPGQPAANAAIEQLLQPLSLQP